MTRIKEKSAISNSRSNQYVIHLKEKIRPDMLVWFDGFSILSNDAGETMLVGTIQDQSALHGLLARIRDLNLTLLSVNRIEPEEK